MGNLPAGGTIVLLDVKYIYVRDELSNDDGINQQLIDAVGKMGGNSYSLTNQLVELTRPE